MVRTLGRLRWYVLGGLGVALALAGAALAGVAAHGGARATRVTVVESEFKLVLSQRTFKPGRYAFVALDKGKLAHSLEISGPGLKSKRIPGTIKPGSSRSLTVTLTKGTYEIWCPVPGHAKLGMRGQIQVGAASGSGATPQPTTTKKTGWG